MIKYIKYKKDYLEYMLKMTKKYYGDIEISRKDYIEHEYFNNPSGDAIITLAYDDEKNAIAGQYIVIPKDIRVNGKEYKCVNSLNTLTGEEYRGLGIFTKLADYNYKIAGENSLFCYGVPNQNSYPGFIKKLRFNDIGEVPLLLRPLKISSLMQKYFKSGIFSKLISPIDVFFKPKIKNKSNYDIIDINDENINLIDEFWNRIQDKYPIMFIRNSKYIKYRYIDILERKYKILMALEKGKPVALIVGRITEIAEIKSGIYLDFIIDKGYEKAGKDLIDAMNVYFYKNEASLIGCLITKKTKEYNILKQNLFFKCPKFAEPQPFPIIIRKFTENDLGVDMLDIDNWYFTAGDYDVI